MSKPKVHRRRDSLRLPSWDYASPAWNFVTICTNDRDPVFGQVHDDCVILSPLGDIARENWLQIPQRPMGIRIDEFVIMPNHVHGIIIIDPPAIAESDVGALHATPLHTNRNGLGISERMSAISPKPRSLGAMIRSYKSAVTRWARRNGFPHFAWQRGYHDHIIRDDGDLSRIRRYILQNPSKWSLDRYHPRC